ncbi:MAG: transcriptional initiation protein Tat [Sphingobacteriales bacterium 50-39]|nr:gluconate 2-dehydrogenase subunit 3 family protein [Sphingobacteriales bacterium]OJW60954.1 MAG: transcriptional initiation protein Tat [Sphingobacteriales bacterium 50-39]
MDRRSSLKALLVGTVSTGVIVEACQSKDKDQAATAASQPKTEDDPTRMPEEKEKLQELQAKDFFTAEEKATLTILADIIIPRDDTSGSASDGRVIDFISFIVQDKPEHQTPLRGGLRWLDLRALNTYEKPFRDLTSQQQLAIVDTIAYPKKAKPEDLQGVHFFTLMRNLTITGFYTTDIGFKDIGYVGNRPNQWNGVPPEVLKQYNLAYTEKELKECISFT